MGRHRGRYAEEPSRRSRGRRGRGGAIAALAAAMTIVVGLAVAGVYMFSQTDGCGGSAVELDVAVAPEIAPALDAVASDFNAEENTVDGSCVQVDVRQADSANIAFGITGSGATMGETDSDVWVPDSSVWPRLVQEEAGEAVINDTGTSLARSPLVLAELDEFADEDEEDTDGSWAELVPTDAPGEGPNSTIRVADPARSSTGLSTLHLLHEVLDEEAPDADTYNAQMTAALQSLHQDASPDEEAAFLSLSGGDEEAPPLMVMSEQALWRYNNLHSENPAQASYMEDGTYYLDYPYIVRGEESETTRAAEEFRSAVQAEGSLDRFQSEGFRDTDGQMDPNVLAPEVGFQEEAPEELAAPSEGAINNLRQSWNQLKMDSRVLTIVDISGSMLAEVPGTDMTRMEVTSTAATEGLQMFPASSEIGLWEFSTNVNDGMHHQEVAPMRELQATAEDGTEHRDVLGEAFATMEPIPTGDTALYDTYLAAYEEMSRTYQQDTTNVILMLTDGDNDHPDGMELEELMSGIEEISDPSEPIQIITIAFGPEVENQEPLQELAAATGGAAYMTEDPREIGDIFLQAFSLRISEDEESSEGDDGE